MVTSTRQENKISVYSLKSFIKIFAFDLNSSIEDIISADISDLFYTSTIDKKIRLWEIENK